MYSKEESARLRQAFWINFGQYMKPIPSATGDTVHWVNYKTVVKNIFFKMDATNKQATISILLTHPNEGIRHLIFEQFEEFKGIFTNTMGEEWVWIKNDMDDLGKISSRIYTLLADFSVFNQNHWPNLIHFFKARILLLDEFWDQVKPVFEDLV